MATARRGSSKSASSCSSSTMESIAFWLLLAAVIAGSILLILAFYRMYSTTQKKEPYQNEPRMLIYFSMNGCGHCQAFNPEWDELVAKVAKDELMKGKITLLKLDAEDARKYGVDRFPTVMYVKGEEKVEYEGERTAAALSEFIDKMMAEGSSSKLPAEEKTATAAEDKKASADK